jgi:putative pyruvate formate lyase activating enzyme
MSYVELYESGELERRAGELWGHLGHCDLCPRRCGVNRLEGELGFCEAGPWLRVAAVCDHHGEEPVLSGERGAGTVFFSSCNLRCVYCQNYQISTNPLWGELLSPRELAERLVQLHRERGVHNFEFVSPSMGAPYLLKTLVAVAELGVSLPVVYNSGGYDGMVSLRALEGVVDLYLPDLKYGREGAARKYSRAARGYWRETGTALKEMFRQVGPLEIGDDGLARRGLLVRHLVLPNDLSFTEEALHFIAHQLSPQVALSLMAQYEPAHLARRIPLLCRRLRPGEYLRALEIAEALGLEEGWTQEWTASDCYQPDFQEQHPFEENPSPGRG